MGNRTLVHMTFAKNCINVRTISFSRKSPHRFYILRSNLEEFLHNPEVIKHVRDINSFATIRMGQRTGTVEIEFTWLSGNDCNLSGYRETITLPYDMLVKFLDTSTLENKPITWKFLSIDNTRNRPQIVFKSRKNLHEALENDTIRHKLVHALRKQFNWPFAEKIELYDDYMPYSFGFNEIKNGKPVMNGGLILHGQENMQKAYYSIHT